MWSEYEIQQVWEKGTIAPWRVPNYWRLDAEGNLIYRFHYGHHWLSTGWDIHHILERAFGGSDHISNLAPLQCKANRAKKPGDWSGTPSPYGRGSADWSSLTLSAAPTSIGLGPSLQLEDVLKALLGGEPRKNPWSRF